MQPLYHYVSVLGYFRIVGKEYTPYRFPNGDTRKELLIRSRYLLFKSADKWTDRQKQRAAILFEEYPDIKTAYGLCHSAMCLASFCNTLLPSPS